MLSEKIQTVDGIIIVSSRRVNENIDQTFASQSQLSSKSALDLKQQIITSDYQETASLMRCRPIPYTSSDEKRSTATLEQIHICSTEHIPLKSKDPDEQLISSESDLKNTLDKPLKTRSDSYNNQSQIEWLDSLLSKMSNNVSSTSGKC